MDASKPQNFKTQIHLPNRPVIQIRLIDFCFPRNNVPTNSVVPLLTRKTLTTYNSLMPEEGITLETSALESLHGGQFI